LLCYMSLFHMQKPSPPQLNP